uniref:Histone deacetylase n=1 Tax=Talaromyces marneffei PM1 TaxID=1077442 RepID=A0A093V872_TALMA
MDRDEDTVMRDPGSLTNIPSSTSGPSSTTLGGNVAGTGPTDDGVQPATLFEMPKLPSGLMSPPAPITMGSTEMPGLTKSIEDEGLHIMKSSEESDSIMEETSDWSADDPASATAVGLPVASLPTGLCYDIRMRYHCEVRPAAEVHPEDPRRIYYIYKEICRAGLVEDPDIVATPRMLAPVPLKRIDARNATKEEVELVHTDEHYQFVSDTQNLPDETLIMLEETRDSIYFNRLTYASALLSAGGAIETCLAVATRKVKNAIAVIRPPGHHAEHDKTMGFCLFNNVSIAAKFPSSGLVAMLIRENRDVHHGNGIQKAFYDDPNVLYMSLHVYADGKFYPGGKEGNWDHVGEVAGLGKNINIPWPSQGMGDGDYMYAFQQVVMPIATEFDPDLVIVASGFDAAAGDELGGCFVTPACYSHMTHMLMTLANGKVAVCLEGGYNFRSISKSALAVTKTLMGEPPARLAATTPSNPAVQVVRTVMAAQSKYWRYIIRQYQAQQLYNNYKLTSLWIYRSSISKSFENQVLASANYDRAVPLIVIFHDPPEMMGVHHPITNKLEPHNCWMADVVKDYIAWATQRNYAVIDVNIPKYVTTDTPDVGKYEEEDADRPSQTEELAGYLWDNYIEPNEATHIFFIGVGDAYYGVANLLINRDSIYQRVNSVISFVAENPVRAVASPTQTWLSRWYKDNSLVFVSHTHGVWHNENRRKPSKRYGRLLRSPKTGLNEMLLHHKPEVLTWIDERVNARTGDETEEEEGEEGNA